MEITGEAIGYALVDRQSIPLLDTQAAIRRQLREVERTPW